MTKPKREDYANDVEFQVAYVAWRRWVVAQRDEDTRDQE
jgi:hypothetical protein